MMSELDKINTSLVEAGGNLQRINVNHGLIKINRLLLTIVLSLMGVIVILGFALLPSHFFLNGYKTLPAGAYAVEMNPVLSAEVNNLKGQLVGLVSGSIESKLRILEGSIRTGALDNSLGMVEDLKNDLKLLRSYSEPPKRDQAMIANEQLMQEVSQLKTLIYLTLASCGLMLAAVAGIWLKSSHILPYKKTKTSYLGKK
jgi:hypothetical protein